MGKLSFIKYIFSNKSNVFLFILSIPLIISIIILYPFIKIKVGELRSRVIGEFATPPEIYLNELKSKILKKKKNEIHLFFFNYKISNYYLANHWRKHFLIFPRIILEPIFYFFFSNRFFKKFLCPLRYEGHQVIKENKILNYPYTIDINNVFKSFNASMKFSNDEVLKGEKALKDLGYRFNQEIVCFANRDSSFKKEKFESTRNAKVETYKSAIKYLANKNIFNLRMGRKNNQKINFSEKNIVDYSFSEIKNDFMDMFIISKCKFFITTSHGIFDLASFFRKNILIVNYVDHNFHFLPKNYTTIVLPKKYKNLNNDKYVHYREVYEKKFHLKSQTYLRNIGYDLIDNNEEEILDATKEMYYLSNNNFKTNPSRQEKFWNLYKSYFQWKPKSLMISNSFYEKNTNLFL